MSTKRSSYGTFETSSSRARRMLRQEELILDVTERFEALLMDKAVSRTELARRLGRSKAFVTQLLAGDRNLTLRTIADLCDALGVAPALVLDAGADHASLPTALGAAEIRQRIAWDRERCPWLAELRVVSAPHDQEPCAIEGKGAA